MSPEMERSQYEKMGVLVKDPISRETLSGPTYQLAP